MTVYRRLAVSAVAAVVSVSAAVVLVSTAPSDSDVLARPTPTSPGAVWTLDAADVLGNEFATFADPVGSSLGEVKGGVVDAGDVLVAKVGLVNQETSEFEKSELVGFDSSTGVVRWTTSAEGIGNCSSAVFGTTLMCSGGGDIVTVDTADGAVTSRATQWNIFSVTTDGTDIYTLEGDPDGYSVNLHRGTLDDPDARWSVPLGDSYIGLATPGDMIQFVGDRGITDFLSSTTVFDLETGSTVEQFDVPDCTRSRSVRGEDVHVVVGRHCSDLFEYRTDMVDSTGRILATVDAEAYQNTLIDAPAEQDDPILLNGSAFDPVTGQMLWSSADYGFSSDIAIVGDVVLAGNAPALDLHTGLPAWEEGVQPPLYTPEVLFDGAVWGPDWNSDIAAIDPATGNRRASFSTEALLGNTGGRSEQVALQDIRDGVVVVNESRLNLIR